MSTALHVIHECLAFLTKHCMEEEKYKDKDEIPGSKYLEAKPSNK